MLASNDFVRLDKAIDKVLNNDPNIVEEGRKELNELNSKGICDDALFFWRADAYAQAYYKLIERGEENKRMLERAISDYKRLIDSGYYEHLRQQLAEWEKEYNS